MKKLLIAIGLVCIAIPFSYLLILNPFEHEADFSLSDFYTKVSVRKSQPRISKDIVIISADGLSRLEIARLARQVDSCGPAAAVVDILMNYPSAEDSQVIEVLSGCRHLVTPYDLYADQAGPVYSYLPNTVQGYANLKSASPEKVIREFRLAEKSHLSMDGAVIKLYKPDLPLPQQGLIRFDGDEIDLYTPDELEKYGEDLKGKIVLIGCIKDFSDCYPTPVGTRPGVLIHASILQTVLTERVPVVANKLLVLIVSILLSIGLMFLHVHLCTISGDIGNLLLRINQIILLYLIYLCGTMLWHGANIYFDLSLAITLVASASVVYDIIYGIPALLKWGKSLSSHGKKSS